jgi:hypothetical protein
MAGGYVSVPVLASKEDYSAKRRYELATTFASPHRSAIRKVGH